MIVNLKTEELKVGMFIHFPEDNWMSNPFWKNKFRLTSEKDIKKIVRAGIKNVDVDTDKSKVQVGAPQEKKEVVVKKNEEKEEKENIVTSVETKKETPTISKAEKKDDIGTEKQPDDVTIEKIKVVDKEEHEKHDRKGSSPPTEWNPKEFMPPEIVDAFNDESLPPDNRAKVIHDYSVEMMKNLFEDPTADALTASKKGMAEIVDVILNEDETARSLTKLVSHDFYTYTHSVNVGLKAMLLAKILYKNTDKKVLEELGAGFFLHDLGKVNINPAIINKRGKFTEEEMATMRTHPELGYEILHETKHLTKEAWIITMQHHERDDGNGYPHKLKGEDIHPYARICTLADVYDALTSKRPYKEKKPPIVALKIMYEEMATHFNKELLENFISLFRGKR
ncbi:MAG: HD-GYP domain-containing protein [Candidatus Anammoxibacter sp.]